MHDHAPAALTDTLADACGALWLATLSLMTAFMHNRAPAHRLLLAQRIATNFDTLAQQPCYGDDCRARFQRLGRRWGRTADSLRDDVHGVQPWASRARRLLGLR